MNKTNKTNTPSVSFAGKSSAMKIFEANPNRSYLNFYAVSGDCYVNIGDNDFDLNAKKIPEGGMWEPRIALTNSIWYKGADTTLAVIAAQDNPVT
jgi:hypothetical protein